MRSADVTQSAMFSFQTLEQRSPTTHPLRKLRVLVDGILASLHGELEKLYAKTGRPSIPPERLLRAVIQDVLVACQGHPGRLLRSTRENSQNSHPDHLKEQPMSFLDGSDFPENQQKLVITCAPYGPEWTVSP